MVNLFPGDYTLFNHWIMGKPIDSSWLYPFTDSCLAAVDTVLPIGSVIFGVVLGIKQIPNILKRLSKIN